MPNSATRVLSIFGWTTATGNATFWGAGAPFSVVVDRRRKRFDHRRNTRVHIHLLAGLAGLQHHDLPGVTVPIEAPVEGLPVQLLGDARDEGLDLFLVQLDVQVHRAIRQRASASASASPAPARRPRRIAAGQ